jgi:hypothetical protein
MSPNPSAAVTLRPLEQAMMSPAHVAPSFDSSRLDQEAFKSDVLKYVQATLASMIDQERKATGAYLEQRKADIENAVSASIELIKTELEPFARKQQLCMHVAVAGAAPVALDTPAHPLLGDLIRHIQPNRRGKRDNVMLFGPAGCGKTSLAMQLAKAIGAVRFHSLTLTDGASESWFLGRWTPGEKFIISKFVECYKNGGVFLIDEMDNGGANLLLLLNTAIENGVLEHPLTGETIQRHPDFILIACCNTVGRGGDMIYTGRNRLDAATLRRFRKLRLDYVAAVDEAMCPDTALREWLISGREKLMKIKSREMISSGCLGRAFDMMEQGFSRRDILDCLTAGWAQEAVTASGLESGVDWVAPAPKQAAPIKAKGKPPTVAMPADDTKPYRSKNRTLADILKEEEAAAKAAAADLPF